MVVDAYRLLAHKAVEAAESADAVRLAGRRLLVAAIRNLEGSSQIELKLQETSENHMTSINIWKPLQ